MTEIPPDAPNLSPPSPTLAVAEAQELVRLLRRKEGTWVDWGQACAKLQKAGYSSQKIFEETGFEPIQQNQVIVAAQVYTSIVNGEASEEVRSHFLHRGSDILYEFRILTQTERAAAASLVLTHKLDVDDAHEVAKAVKELSRIRTLPEGFSRHPGDAVAYQCWQLARQQSDLQERSRLIARGLKLAHTQSARQQLERLLTDFTVVRQRPAPRLPIYRLETEEEVPRVLPVVGSLPLTTDDWQAVPLIEEIPPFQIIKFSGSGAGAWVPVPGWSVISSAEDPVALLARSEHLPAPLSDRTEEVLIVVERAQRQWQADSYFIADNQGEIEFQWFEEAPELPLLGRVILVMRPKKILDEGLSQDVWQIDE